MRTKNIKSLTEMGFYRLNKAENELLKNKCDASGYKISVLVRKLIRQWLGLE